MNPSEADANICSQCPILPTSATRRASSARPAVSRSMRSPSGWRCRGPRSSTGCGICRSAQCRSSARRAQTWRRERCRRSTSGARGRLRATGASTTLVGADRILFRDFVCLYLAEGYKRNRNVVEVCNSDPAVVRLCDEWLRRLSSKPRHHSIQYHADQDLDELRRFWAAELGIDPGRSACSGSRTATNSRADLALVLTAFSRSRSTTRCCRARLEAGWTACASLGPRLGLGV